MLNKKNIGSYIYFFVLIGCLVGSLLFLIIKIKSGMKILDLDLQEYPISSLLNLSEEKLFFYILEKRVGQIILFIALASLCSYSVAAFTYCFCSGFCYGIVLCEQIVQYGINGLFFGLSCFFPHYLIYIFVIYFLLKLEEGKHHYTNKKAYSVIFRNFFLLFLLMVAIGWEIIYQKKLLKIIFDFM